MKDAFLAYCRHVYAWIYSSINWIVYVRNTNRMTKGLPDITNQDKRRIRDYWRNNFGVRVSMKEYKWYQQKDRELSPRLIPSVIWHSKVEPYFCNFDMLIAFSDKNYLDMLLGKENVPNTICRCISGQILNSDYQYVPLEKLCSLLNTEGELIVKPSVDSGGGRGIQFIEGAEITTAKILEMQEAYKGNFVLQRKVKQHEFFSNFNKDSLNTIRVVSLLYNDKVHILSGFLRVGGKGMKLDNISSGGCFIGINKEGILLDKAYRENMKTSDSFYDEALSREMNLQEQPLPFWDKIKDVIIDSHFRLAHFKLIYWDIAVNEQEKPIIIECNLTDSDAYDHQLNIGPILGDLTDDVLAEVFHK